MTPALGSRSSASAWGSGRRLARPPVPQSPLPLCFRGGLATEQEREAPLPLPSPLSSQADSSGRSAEGERESVKQEPGDG